MIADSARIRYINMDFIYASSVGHFPGVERMTTYDIACQWAVHLEERIAQLPEGVRVDVAPFKELRYAIGKLHWHAHKKEDHSRFSLNLVPGSCRTDGEGVERRWGDIYPATLSTKMMGPGGREGVLNDVLAFANWLKIMGIRKSFHLAWGAPFNVQCSPLYLPQVHPGLPAGVRAAGGVRDTLALSLGSNCHAVGIISEQLGEGPYQARRSVRAKGGW